MPDSFKDIEKLEAALWEAADNLRANSKLTSSEYCMPVLGIIFLRHASNRYNEACRQIIADQATGNMANEILSKLIFLSVARLCYRKKPATMNYSGFQRKQISEQRLLMQ